MNAQDMLKELQQVLDDAKEKMLGIVERHAEQESDKDVYEECQGLQEEIDDRIDELSEALEGYVENVEFTVDLSDLDDEVEL